MFPSYIDDKNLSYLNEIANLEIQLEEMKQLEFEKNAKNRSVLNQQPNSSIHGPSSLNPSPFN